MKNIVFICHRHPFLKGGGAEKSVSIIMRYLKGLGHNVWGIYPGATDATFDGITIIGGGIEHGIRSADFIFTWGSVAKTACRIASDYNTPYCLMVRWWRNVTDVSNPIGDLMRDPIDSNFVKEHRFMFQNAKAVVTNNHYSAKVIERRYGIKAIVSYVPIEGEANNIAKENGFITIVSPDKNIGEREKLIDIARALPENYLIVNAPECDKAQYNSNRNIKTLGYVSDMKDVWRQTRCLISPIYENDICGTLRVNIEAQQHGVPVIANDRCGLSEKVKNVVPYSATTGDWVKKLVEICLMGKWKEYNKEAIQEFEKYNTQKQLEIFSKVIQ